MEQLTKLYEGKEGYTGDDATAKIQREVVADLVGDYLFTDKAFVQKLSTQNRSLFQKIFDEIKYLCKVVTAGSKEAKQLLEVKKAFEEAYRAETKNPTGEGGVRYSISEIVGASGNNYGVGVHLDSTLLDNLTPEERAGMVKEYVKELGGSVFTAYDAAGNAVDVIIEKAGAKFKNKSGRKVSVNKDLTSYLDNEVKQEAIILVDELIQTSSYQGKEPATHPHDWLDNNGANDWDLWKTYIQDKNNTVWEASLRIANSANGEKILYDIFPIKKVEGAGTSAATTTTNNIAQTKPTVNTQNSLSEQGQYDIAPLPWQVRGRDVELEDIAPIGENVVTKQNTIAEDELAPVREDAVATPREYISLEDYANNESPVWRNVGYADEETKTTITQETHDRMVSSGAVVTVAGDVMAKVEKSFPDLRSMKKTERTPILKEAINKLKSNIRQFLTGLSNQNFEFEVNGRVLEAKLYSTGINEVLEKVTREKANMLYSTEEIFRNAQYLYSTPDYDGDPNVYRWNYFYTPVQIGEEIVGVRIAVRDVVKGVGMTPESQIYNWGIKKDASLDGGRRGPRVASSGVSSDASNNNIPQTPPNVNPDDSTGAAPDVAATTDSSEGELVSEGKVLAEDAGI